MNIAQVIDVTADIGAIVFAIVATAWMIRNWKLTIIRNIKNYVYNPKASGGGAKVNIMKEG